ncbi:MULTISPECIES: hypothetical protein [Chryseobacterium]|uniref:hypothetical protein n=1 Tax=Chryseobacterium TaxID=59732 RepID=UPI000C9E9F7B|nr:MULTISPECIES: hypothetical protein [Chryseobacterium]VXB76067.1 conserved hypothetical protein [Chryseobacterium sp. 8AT]
MRRTIQKQTALHIFLFLRGKLIYLVAMLCILLSPAQLYISDSTIVFNIHEIHIIKLDTLVVAKKSNVSANRKLATSRAVINNKIIKQIKLKSVNPPNQFYRNNTSNYFIYTRGKIHEAVTSPTQFNKWIAFLEKINPYLYFIDKKCSNLIKYKESNTISFFHKITLARPPPQL